LLHTSLVLGATVACGANANSTDAEAFGTVSAGAVAELSVGTLKAIDNAPAYVGRDAGGIYAMSSTCTHEGCDMIADGSVSAAGVHCGCHGSRFDATGNVVLGPATEPLAHFEVTLDAMGNISVDGSKRVSASTRVAVT
jgi:cytochrome b6-f complex iron-sulfur subunit